MKIFQLMGCFLIKGIKDGRNGDNICPRLTFNPYQTPATY